MTLKKLQSQIESLVANPPAFSPCPTRDRAFLEFGEFLEKNAREGQPCDLKKSDALWLPIQERLAAAFDDIDSTLLGRDQVTAWQWYNSGVIIKSDDVVIGMDVIPMPRFFGWDEPEGLTERIAGQLDLLLVTHRHEDHFDKDLVNACLRFGKPVYMPKAMALDWGYHSNLHGVEDGYSTEVDDLNIVARQGYHVWRQTMEDVPLIYYEVTCQEGYNFIFGGDVDYTKAFEKTPDKYIDLFFLPWRNPNELYEDGREEQIGKTLDAVNIAIERIAPAKLLYEHCAELDHVYGGFSPSFDMALDLKKQLPIPSELMFWGEKIALSW